MEGTQLFGCGQPSHEGFIIPYSVLLISTGLIKSLGHLEQAGFEKGMEWWLALTVTVVWVNLREEPVTYMNGTPFAPRDVCLSSPTTYLSQRETLNINLDHLIGIEGMDLGNMYLMELLTDEEHMEQRMRADLIRKAHLNNYTLEYASQDKQMNNQIKHMLLNPKMGFSPKELFNMVSLEQDLLG